ncbi:MAG: shikimate kinase [Candidatus Niyogibacteria bacterium]|nr:shikimate kinase [Candidatus Niyogibacteria bacterium]
MNFTLIGMPAAGKSFLGKKLAERAGFAFLDMDEVMEKEYGEKITAIAAKLGDAEFIKKESEVAIANTARESNFVISTGGSMVYSDNAMRHLREISKIIYLRVPLSTIKGRIGGAPRGIIGLHAKTLKELYEERCILYEKYADATFDADRAPEAVIDDAVEWMRRYTA